MDGDDRGTLIPRIPCPIKEYSSVSYDEPVDLAGYDRAFELLEGGAAGA